MQENGKKKISVIIPVYRTEKYLKYCLDSVVRSDVFEDCEIILVDDGSPDGSWLIAKSYAEQYGNVRLKRQENAGLSAARNTGLRMAEGEYVFFLDSDDEVFPGYISALYKAAVQSGADVVLAGFSRWNGKVGDAVDRVILHKAKVMSGVQWLERRMDYGDWENYVWCALYRRGFLLENQLSFDDVRLYEDILFSTKALLFARVVTVVPEYGYLYRIREGSLVQSGVRKRDVEALFEILDGLKALYRLSDEKCRHAIGRVYFQVISMMLYYVGQMKENGIIHRKEAREYIKRIQKLHLEKVLKKAAVTKKEKVKKLIFRFSMASYYHIVRKRPPIKRIERQNAQEEYSVMASVIIPVYNSEDYLKRCLDSICTQEYLSYEVLLIDDGSTDKSAEICMEYATCRTGIYYFRQDHAGVAAARNCGIGHANGKYLLFVDSDDFISPFFVGNMVAEMEKSKADLGVCNYYEHDIKTGNQNRKLYDRGTISLKKYLLGMAGRPVHNYYGVCWNKAFKRELVYKYKLRFPIEMSYGEDFVFLMSYLNFCKQICTVKRPGYYYSYRREGSLNMEKRGDERFLYELSEVYDSYRRLWSNVGLYRRYEKLVQYYGVKIYFEEVLGNVHLRDESMKKLAYQKILEQNGISGVDFFFFSSLRKLKQALKRRK